MNITPDMIDASKHFFNAFNHTESEISAGYIVRFCQSQSSWNAFTLEQIEEFYNRSGYKGFKFNRLLGGSYTHMTARSFPYGETRTAQAVIFLVDGKYQVSDAFIEACYRSSPTPASEVRT